MSIKIKNSRRKVRVNITVDKELLEKAKDKLNLFGGKLSTLFNAYLSDFTESISTINSKKELNKKIEELEKRLKKLEGKNKSD